MTLLDYVVLLIVGVSIALGYWKGLIKGAIALLSALVALLIAAQTYEYAAMLFEGSAASARAANLLGFALIFVAVLMAGSLFSRWLRKGIKRAQLAWVDHWLGAGFGLLRGWLIGSTLYLALTAFPVKLEAVEHSVFAPVLLEGTRLISYLTSSEMRERFYDGYLQVQQIWHEKR